MRKRVEIMGSCMCIDTMLLWLGEGDRDRTVKRDLFWCCGKILKLNEDK
jgi:hypothetical protein